MKTIIEIKGNDKIFEKFKNYGQLFVGYCLVKQFVILFNDEGKPKIRIFKGNQSFMSEHAAMIGKVLDKRSVDIEYYKRILKQIETKIYKICKDGKVDNDEKLCKNYVKELLNDWNGYCLIERKNTNFERPEEWALIYNQYIHEDGFSLADSSFMGIDMLLMPGIIKESKEWAELYNDALDRFNLHKLTLTEAHHLLVSVSDLLYEKEFNFDNISYALNKTKINYEINEELVKLNKQPNNINQMEIVQQKLNKLETEIHLRMNLQQCSLAVYLLKFTLANINLNKNSLSDQQKFLVLLQNNLKGVTDNIGNGDKEINKKAEFVLKVCKETIKV
uniref:Uncharacterized protein n=1 Tax=Meloidogyne hapla TaxID=6305 RepID=A0A1I8B6N2_MELHA